MGLTACIPVTTEAAYHIILAWLLFSLAVGQNADTAVGPVLAAAAYHISLAWLFFSPAVGQNADTAAGPVPANAALVGVLVANMVKMTARYAQCTL